VGLRGPATNSLTTEATIFLIGFCNEERECRSPRGGASIGTLCSGGNSHCVDREFSFSDLALIALACSQRAKEKRLARVSREPLSLGELPSDWHPRSNTKRRQRIAACNIKIARDVALKPQTAKPSAVRGQRICEPQTSAVQDDCAGRRMLCGNTNQNGAKTPRSHDSSADYTFCAIIIVTDINALPPPRIRHRIKRTATRAKERVAFRDWPCKRHGGLPYPDSSPSHNQT
jgi:hypothetical protein